MFMNTALFPPLPLCGRLGCLSIWVFLFFVFVIFLFLKFVFPTMFFFFFTCVLQCLMGSDLRSSLQLRLCVVKEPICGLVSWGIFSKRMEIPDAWIS